VAVGVVVDVVVDVAAAGFVDGVGAVVVAEVAVVLGDVTEVAEEVDVVCPKVTGTRCAMSRKAAAKELTRRREKEPIENWRNEIRNLLNFFEGTVKSNRAEGGNHRADKDCEGEYQDSKKTKNIIHDNSSKVGQRSCSSTASTEE